MFKSTLFIAVQCCQCSTMQVKQQKKSSNKWVCVICNQKQSVKKIYAQGYHAKDIRQFVQSFNMSRKDADEPAAVEDEAPSVGDFVERLEGSQVEEEHKPKKRADWSEYIGDEDRTAPAYLRSLPNEGHSFEPEIVTEIPEGLMFTKAKMKGKLMFNKEENCTSQVSRKEADADNLPRNVKRGWQQEFQDTRKEANDDILPRTRTVKRGREPEEQEHRLQQQQQSKQLGRIQRDVSKWSEYIEDENQFSGGETLAFADDLKIMCGYQVETAGDDKVEEDIHPDFM